MDIKKLNQPLAFPELVIKCLMDPKKPLDYSRSTKFIFHEKNYYYYILFLVKSKVCFHVLFQVGDGVCRGPGWNAKSAWPKVKGKKSLMECGEQCANTLGCTSFDIRLPTGEGQNKKYECTLHGHADIEPASGISGTCFRQVFP